MGGRGRASLQCSPLFPAFGSLLDRDALQARSHFKEFLMPKVNFTGIGILGLALVLPSGLAAQDKDMKGMHMEMPKGKDVKITGMVVMIMEKPSMNVPSEI